jgi:hypothetical protein
LEILVLFFFLAIGDSYQFSLLVICKLKQYDGGT